MKRLIITGASSGIGLAIVKRFRRDGYTVVNISRHPCPEPGVANLVCDLAQPGAADGLGAALSPWLEFGTQICVVHNASAIQLTRVDTLSSADLRAALELNLVAPSAINRLLIPHLPPGSSILFIGSTLAEKAVPGVASYVIAKHGVVGMMRATCQDLAGRGIHTCMICPGFTDTTMLRSMIGDSAETLASMTALSAFDRLIEPDEIADVVAFAAGAPVLNGAVIHANLGQRER
ncbi:MAG TPA: SDR family oxidoreductase [Lamprocystis sp. (in: g-proteobacteria)]|nr:SDR family oxidoreductase [Lamprocystis sp. (in: g-proteobacteria)]